MKSKQKQDKKSFSKWILIFVVIFIVIYIFCSRILGVSLTGNGTVLREDKQIISLNIKENSYIGLNGKQIIKVNRDGIIAYDLDGYEIWSDTFTAINYIVKQREPYIAVGTKEGKQISLFNTKGKVTEIVCDYPIIYFSVNESGGISVIQSLDGGHMVAGYNAQGQYLGGMVTYTDMEGYPTNVELSPNNEILIATYIKTDEPVLTSSIRAIHMQKTSAEEGQGVKYGITAKEDFIYEVEFIKDNVWLSIGDKKITWYDIDGNEIASKMNITSIYRPYLTKRSSYGAGFFPIISSENATSNIIQRKDKLTYWNARGEESFVTDLPSATDYLYIDARGVVIGSDNQFIGYNKIGSETFSYKSSVDVSKVFYLSEIRKGIAVTKEGIILLTPTGKVA
ncbi:MAG: hypothetical protein IJ086_11945 [Clostridium sp.]|nr:hypothetical protein [Clostridium sp.]